MVLVRHNMGVAMMIENISLGGVQLVGPLTVQPGERIEMLFQCEQQSIEVAGEVVRVERPDMINDRIAIRFLELADEQRILLEQLVRHLVDHSLDADRTI